jgi:hypothetical protein
VRASKRTFQEGEMKFPRKEVPLSPFKSPVVPGNGHKNKHRQRKKLESALTTLVFNGILAGFACEKA